METFSHKYPTAQRLLEADRSKRKEVQPTLSLVDNHTLRRMRYVKLQIQHLLHEKTVHSNRIDIMTAVVMHQRSRLCPNTMANGRHRM